MKSKQLFRIGKGIFLISTLCIFLFGCSSSPVSVAKKSFEDQISSASQSKLKVVSFDKVNGVKREVFGQEIYELEYKAVIEFVQSGWKDDGWLSGGYAVYDKEPTGWDAWNHEFKYHEKGSQIIYTGKMNLQKKENGWSVD